MNKEALSRAFFARDALTVARELLGKTLVHGETGGIIVETEAYIGPGDKGSHAYGGRRTKRTEPLFGEAGCAYVYLIYGLYCCLNVVTGLAEEPQCVLIRALRPDVPCRLVVFPGENHSLTRTGLMHNRIRHMLEIRRWMEKYLNGREATP